MLRNRVICIVDDDAAAASGLARRLAQRGYQVHVFTSASAFLSFGPGECPDCLLLDADHSDPSPFQLQMRLAQQGDAVPVIFISSDGDIPMAVRAMKAGAIDFLTKPVTEDALMAAVARALAKADERRTVRVRRAWARELVDRLTPREREVFLHLLAGKRNKQIAGALASREATIKVHRSRLMRKLESRTLTELMRIGRELELETGVSVDGPIQIAPDIHPLPMLSGRHAGAPASAFDAWTGRRAPPGMVAANDTFRDGLFAHQSAPVQEAGDDAPKRRPRIPNNHSF
jgi:FixJ family two-component response regulator